MQRLNTDEVKAVLAHELSHVRNRDVAVITLASFLSTVAAFIMQSFMFGGMYGGRDRRDTGGAHICCCRVAIDRLFRQPAAGPAALAVPGTFGRPGLGHHHRPPVAPDQRAPEDQRRHAAGADARPAGRRRQGHEPVLHHSRRSAAGRSWSSSPPIRRWRSASGS